MSEQEEKPENQKKHSRRYIYGKYFVAILLVSIIVLVGAYSVFTIITKNSVLPRVNIAGLNVGGLSQETLKGQIASIAKLKDEEKVVFVNENERISKKYSEIGISVNQDESL